ncbi:MAG: thiolase family protein [Lautropia sp.]
MNAIHSPAPARAPIAGQAAIIGAGMAVHPTSSGYNPTPLELDVKAARAAIAEAGIDRSSIGALLTAPPPTVQKVSQFCDLVINELKIAPRHVAQVGSSCAGALGSIQIAASLVAGGTVDYVLCCAGDTNYGNQKFFTTSAVIGDPMCETPYGITAPATYAQMASRYMHEYGVTSEQFARVAVANRQWALDHPLARMRDKGPLTVDDVLASPVIASPLHLFDAAPWFNGGIAGAVVIARADRARHAPTDPLYLLGFGQRTTHTYLTERLGLRGIGPYFEQPSLVVTGTGAAAADAYGMSGLTPNDVDLVESSGPFTSFLMRALEELGFCKDGEGGDFVAAGGIDRNAGLPFNTYGGMLSFGQLAQPMYPLIEAILQLRGRAERRQVTDPKIALVHGHGGPISSQAVLLLGRQPV